MIADDALPYRLANGLNVETAWLKQHGPTIFVALELKEHVSCFEAPGAPRSAGEHIHGAVG